MDSLDQIAATLAMSMGAAWASGINLYAAILTLGLMGASGNIDLPPGLEVLQEPLVLFAAGTMYAIEFFADKVPGFDSSWDLLHTFVRIPAGAIMAASAVGDVTPAVAVAAGIMGAGLAATTHVAKSGSRALINTSPEPFSNWMASISEDVAVIAAIWASLHHPQLFLLLMLLFIALMIWLLPKLWRAIQSMFRKIRRAITGKPPSEHTSPDNAAIANNTAPEQGAQHKQ